jgi:hypothetical protein
MTLRSFVARFKTPIWLNRPQSWRFHFSIRGSGAKERELRPMLKVD